MLFRNLLPRLILLQLFQRAANSSNKSIASVNNICNCIFSEGFFVQVATVDFLSICCFIFNFPVIAVKFKTGVITAYVIVLPYMKVVMSDTRQLPCCLNMEIINFHLSLL